MSQQAQAVKPLAGDVARCEGQPCEFGVQPQCLDCRRRTSEPVGMWQPFMQAPEDRECAWRIAPC